MGPPLDRAIDAQARAVSVRLAFLTRAHEAIASCAITDLPVTVPSRSKQGSAQVPKVSAKTTAKVDDFGVAIDRNDELDGYAFSFVTINEDHRLAPMLSGLPEGRCWCPHWGYVFRGQITVTYADREEVFEAGDAFYMTPGSRAGRDEGQRVLADQPGGSTERNHCRDSGSDAAEVDAE